MVDGLFPTIELPKVREFIRQSLHKYRVASALLKELGDPSPMVVLTLHGERILEVEKCLEELPQIVAKVVEAMRLCDRVALNRTLANLSEQIVEFGHVLSEIRRHLTNDTPGAFCNDHVLFTPALALGSGEPLEVLQELQIMGRQE